MQAPLSLDYETTSTTAAVAAKPKQKFSVGGIVQVHKHIRYLK